MPSILLLDTDAESRENISFVLGIAKFQIRAFAEADECLNWLSVMRAEADDCVSIVLNGQMERGCIAGFISALEGLGLFLPILAIDRFKRTLQKSELLRDTFTKLPVYICEAEEITVMLNHFIVLKTHLAEKNSGFRFLFQN